MSEEERDDLITAEDAVEEVLQEETEQEEVEEEVSEEEVEEKPSDPEAVARAKKYGHLDKEEWVAMGRNPDDWKSPEEFDKTGKVIEQLYTLKKKVDQRDREIQALIDYQQRTSQREYERAKQDLEARLAAAEDDLDVKAVSHYTKELTRLEDMETQSQNQSQQTARQSAQEAFIERNQHWFNDRNPDLKQRAIEIDNELKEVFPNATFEQLAEKIEKRMSYEHPERVLSQVKARPVVSSSQSSVNKAASQGSSRKVFQGLSQELKDTYTAHKRIRASMGEELTEAEFIERLKADGEI